MKNETLSVDGLMALVDNYGRFRFECLDDEAKEYDAIRAYAEKFASAPAAALSDARMESFAKVVIDAERERVAAAGPAPSAAINQSRLPCSPEQAIAAWNRNIAGPALEAGAPSLRDVAEFLLGECPLDGTWFGATHPSGQSYWWRKHLRAALSGQPAMSESSHQEKKD